MNMRFGIVTKTTEQIVHEALWDIVKDSFKYEIESERNDAVGVYRENIVKKGQATRRKRLKQAKKK